jgi:multisubunit Na+/H+ antiporter MnhC subunit
VEQAVPKVELNSPYRYVISNNAMKRMIVLTVVFAVALFLAYLIIGVQIVEAQFTQDGQGFPIASPITILSPSKTTYNSSLLTLNVTSKFLLKPNLATFSYSLDGENNATLPIDATFVPIETLRTYANGTTETGISIFSYYRLSGDVALPELSEGTHTLTVFAEYQANNIIGLDACTVYFTVNYATDLAGNIGASETIRFSIAEPFPTALVTSVIVLVAIISVGLLVYFKKCNKSICK